MFNIYFRNEQSQYYRPIHLDTINEAFSIIALYRYIVPNILLTDAYDFALMEIKKGIIYHPEQESIDLFEQILSGSLSSISNDFDFISLIEDYKSKIVEIQGNNNTKLKEKLRSLDMKILAVTANNNINLAHYSYTNSEVIITMIEEANIQNKNDISQLLDNFKEELNNGKTLVIMPLSRVIFDDPFQLNEYFFFPPNSIDFNQSLNIQNELFQNELRTFHTLSTQFTIDTLYDSFCIAFTYNLNWKDFQSYTLHDDITLLKILSSYANEIFNLIRFDTCDFHLPDTLPGEVGSWSQSLDYLGAMLYNKEERNNAYLIAGSAIEATKIVKGLGLDMNGADSIRWSYENAHETMLQIIKNSLTLYSDAMQSHSSTTKFLRIMTLFEYMAFPHEYKKFQEVKKNIICHCATTNTEYQTLSDRFQTLSQVYRTEVAHNGKTLELILPNYEERQKLFQELQMYCKNTLSSMFFYQEESWGEFMQIRKKLIDSLHK